MGTCEGRVGWLAIMRCNGSNWAVYFPGSWDGFRNDLWALWAGVIMPLEHHLVGGYVRYISPYIIIIIINIKLISRTIQYWMHTIFLSAYAISFLDLILFFYFFSNPNIFTSDPKSGGIEGVELGPFSPSAGQATYVRLPRIWIIIGHS